MRTLLLLLGSLFIVPLAHGHAYWNDIRHSALQADETVTIRLENPSGPGIENYALYRAGGIVAAPMAAVVDGPATVEATVPGPVTETRHYGFRLLDGAELDLMPVRLENGAAPAPAELTQVAPDAAGDELFGYENLDLLDCRVSFADDALHASLENVSGTFPVVQGLSFFGYLLGIADPSVADPDTIFALMYTYEQAGIISPGLYKVTGTGLGDLELLGAIEVVAYPAANSLRLTCQLSDLLSDPDFSAWFDPEDPVLSVAGFTQRITFLGGAQEADRTPGGRCHLRQVSIAPGVNHLPELADVVFEGDGPSAQVALAYFDPDGHCPIVSEVVFDGSTTHPLTPLSLDYADVVTYQSAAGIEPLASGTWQQALFRFSDNGTDWVELEVTVAGVADEGEGPGLWGPARATPNPCAGASRIVLSLAEAAHVRAAIYDVRGALVKSLLDEPRAAGPVVLTWDGRDRAGRRVAAGLYHLRATDGTHAVRQRLVRVR